MSTARSALDRSLVGGVAWTGLVTWGGSLLTWASTLLVVRLVSPADYGLVGLAMIYLGLVRMLSDFGLGAALIRFRDLSRDQVAQFNTLAVQFGLGCMVLSLLLAVPLGAFFHEPRLAALVAVMSLVDLIVAFRVVPQAQLQKGLKFRRLALLDGIQGVVNAVVTVLLALMGWGYWSLVFGGVVSALVASILTCAAEPTPFRRPRWDSVRQPLTFSGHILTTRTAWYVYSNADFFVVGKVLGPAALGFYTLGWTLSGVAIEKITTLVVRITPAVFSAAQTDLAELRRYLVLLTEVVSIVAFPVCLGVAITADDLVPVALGPGWNDAIAPLRLLAISAALRSVLPFVNQALAAIGQAHVSMQNALVSLLVLPVGFYFGARWAGVAGVAGAWLVLSPMLAVPLYIRALRRLELGAMTYFRCLWPALSSSVAMVTIIFAIDQWLGADSSPVLALAANVVVGAVVYVVALMLMHRERMQQLRDTIRHARINRDDASDAQPVVAPLHTPAVAPTAS